MTHLAEDTDVLVVGGGTAGHIAALQAARLGARTVLLESGSMLGGVATAGGVCAPAYFWSRKRQIIAGIGWELTTRSIELDSGVLPNFSNPPSHRPSYHVLINPSTYALVAEEACLAAGVTLLYHETAVAAVPRADGPGWEVTAIGRGIERTLRCRELIDASGGAQLAAGLGFPMERDAETQPGTLIFHLTGYDLSLLDAETIERRYQSALAEGLLEPGDFCYAKKPFIDFLKSGGSNQQHIFGADDSTSAGQTDADIRGRASLLRLLRFVRSLPGCEAARIGSMRPSTAVRETDRIVGETRITIEDYLAGRVYPDAVAWTLYFVDIHNHEGTHHEFLHEDTVPTIPHGALIPKGSRHLQAVGRCISSDRKAHSALRVQASCMAMGQAAGAAAALGVQQGRASRDVPIDVLRHVLRAQGALVPEVNAAPAVPAAPCPGTRAG